ncbi:MAG TPA: DNA polymerase III subunit gamma/tau [Clostridiaceae bacterium]|nr:DNA polymerase III subunit gamma/tau [Clostridiaceae bacterium]
MSYLALYRKWRPLVFEDVVEQEHVVKTLKHSVSSGHIAHAYLFCGTRGTGKTTMAHILSRAINCLNPQDGNPCNECEICTGIISGSILDVLEIDAASNNSVDNIREIRDEVVYAPSQAKYKVYIIDEVHMLSTGAFNALLKTLEEPPPHVVFILATTEPHKLPATILSRCQRFDFRRISIDSIIKRLEVIAAANGVTVDSNALRLIARKSDGALRDAISLLDQCMSSGSKKISYDEVLSLIGIVNETFMTGIVQAIKERNTREILRLIDRLVMEGKDIPQFTSDLVLYYRNLLMCKVTDDPSYIIDASKEAIRQMKALSDDMDREEIIYMIKELSQLESDFKWAVHPRVQLEITLVRICENEVNKLNNDILSRLSALERKVDNLCADQQPAVKPASMENAPLKQYERQEKPEKASSKVSKAQMPLPEKEPKPDKKYLDMWDEVLNELKNCGRMAIYTFLLGTKAVELGNRIIGIVFGESKKSNIDVCSRAENIRIIEEIAGRILGREVKVKCIDEDDINIDGNDNPPDGSDEVVEKAQEIADKLNVPLNIIDE